MGVRPLPISKDEFARMLHLCIPPVGWMERIGVANSGGPDSTCLLFLIHRYLSNLQQKTNHKTPQHIVSFTIDHDLQQASSFMAEHCEKFARSLGIQHIASKINWGVSPFPPKPSESQPIELVARSARYYSLFHSMRKQNVNIIAFGHHADDQVETSLIRLSMGSSAIGAGGMRSCRRWGMGVDRENEVAYFGYEGLNRWIVRPLLDVGKERILATCEENSLDYVTDRTNFQPAMTLRNAIRHEIHYSRHAEQLIQYPLQIAERLTTLKRNIISVQGVSVSLDSSIGELRRAVGLLALNVRDIDRRVDSLMKHCSLPSPTGTFLLLHEGIRQIEDAQVRKALVLRVVRYASYHPWGSMQADAGRRRKSIDRIIQQIWSPVHDNCVLRPFTAGGGVLWTPILIRGGIIKTPERLDVSILRHDDKLAWLASRQPPVDKGNVGRRSLTNELEIDVTNLIVEGLETRKSGHSSTVRILYDCRFLVRFELERMPEELASRLLRHCGAEKILLYPESRWYRPKAVLQSSDAMKTLHNKINKNATDHLLDLNEHKAAQEAKQGDSIPIDSGWIAIEWIRPLTAL